MKRNGRGRVLSLESVEYWAGITSHALARHGLDRYATVRYVPCIEASIDGRRAWQYAQLPEGTPDFVYLDGPELDEAHPFTVDPLALEQQRGPIRCLVIDGRKANYNLLRRSLQGRYRFRWRPVQYNGVIEVVASSRTSRAAEE